MNHKATKSKTNTGTTALERSVEQTTEGFKALLQLANFTLGQDKTTDKVKIYLKSYKFTDFTCLSIHQNTTIKMLASDQQML